MCGIAGIFVSKPGRVDLSSIVERMQSAIRHRGPDDEGTFINSGGRVALAHTRLSILDLSAAGHQPMSSPDGRYCITYNGEIYNYRSLREELSREHGAASTEQRAKSMEPGAGSAVAGHPSPVSDNGQKSEVGDQLSAISHTQSAISNRPSAINQRSEIRDQLDAVSREPLGVRRDNAKNAINSKDAPDWHSNSDTEVILRAYAKWGRDCVNHLRGMFAFAIWDEQEQELFLARDPFGIKPLYYYESDGLFLFASEIRALLASGSVPRRLSREGLASYLQYGSVQDPLTIINGVQSLLPGHCLVIKLDNNCVKVKEFSYQSRLTPHPLTPNDSIGNPPSTRREAVNFLRSKLEDSVRAHLVSDVPVAAFLSGGIDSSAIVGLMSRVSKERPRTFNVSFDEAKFSEQSYANLIARKFETEHEDIRLSAGTLVSMLPDALAAMDQPTMDGINSYVVSKAVRDAGIKVALSGLGGDELFAGYPSFRRAMQLGRIATAPSAIRHFASTAGRAFTNGSARHRKFWDLVESDCSPYAAYAISRQLFAPSEITALTRGQRSEVRGQQEETRGQTSEIRGRQEAEIRGQLLADGEWRMAGPQFEIRNPQFEIGVPDVINEVSRYELTGYMVNTLLRDTDQMSMAHALEVRVPFVDPEVVSFVMGLQGEWKINGGRPKPLLVDALGDLLPEEIWKRRKMGFTLPLEHWMRSSMANEIDETLSGGEDLARIGLDPDHARSIWHAFKKNPKHEPWSRPWALYVLVKWCVLNGVAA